MKETIRHTFFNLALTALFASAIFTACSDLSKSTASEQSSSSYTVSGNIAIGNAARSATSSFGDLSEIEWNVTAYQLDSDGNPNEDTKRHCSTSGGFALQVPFAGEWYFSAEGFVNENKIAASKESKKVTVTSEGKSDILLEAFPLFSEEVTGSISLTIEDATVKLGPLSSVTYSGENITDGVGRVSFEENSAAIVLESVPAGSHEVTFKFYNDDNTELYSCTEVITVFSGFSTDTWYGESSHTHFNEEDGSYHFQLDDDLLRGYQPIEVVDYPLVLWNLCTEYSPSDTFAVLSGEQITENVSLTDTGIKLGRGTVKNFCIDSATQKIYVREDGNIIKYPSYAGYNRGNALTSDKSISTFCAYNDVLWYTALDEENNESISYKFYQYKNGQTTSFDAFDDMEEAITFTSKPLLASDDDYLYTLITEVTKESSYVTEATFTIKKFALSQESEAQESLTQTTEFTVTATGLGIVETDATSNAKKLCGLFKATDFILSNDGAALYMLISDLDGSYSRGGLIKFSNSVSNGTQKITLEEIDGSKVYGWYGDGICAPSASGAENCFYGPQKFIARKPDELYIADEGSYDYDTNGDRIVKLNLKDLSKTVTDVQVAFNSYNDSGFKGQNGN